MNTTTNNFYFDPFYQNAYKAYSEIDVGIHAHTDFLDGTRSFLKDCKICPTKAITALKSIKSGQIRAPKFYLKNKKYVLGLPDISNTIEKLKADYKTEYHNTWFVRNQFLRLNRVVYGKIVPRSKTLNFYIKCLNIMRCFFKSF